MNAREKVKEYYDTHYKDEDRRLDDQPFEIPVMMHFIEKYLSGGQYIFDSACGTGRIAEIMLEKGFKMGLNDLSDCNVELSNKRLSKYENLLFCNQADAVNSEDWKRESWDAIFILGPLYHLINRENRLKVLRLAAGSVKKGGYVFSSFMTRTSAMVFGLKDNPEGILQPMGVNELWATGTDENFVMGTEWFENGYFSNPVEINPLITEAGLTPLHLAGAEGIFGERLELYHNLPENLKKPWMDFVIGHCEDPNMVNLSKHLLSVAVKK